MARAARADTSRLWLGIDPVAANMARVSARPPANALFALGSVEAMPGELAGLASLVTVNLPWGSLLRAVAAPDSDLLRNLAVSCTRGAELRVTFSASMRDAKELTRLGLAQPDPCRRAPDLERVYDEAGFALTWLEPLSSAELRDLGTTWAKRLWRDPDRRAWRIVARRGD